MELDKKYLTTVPGVLKIAQWVLSLLVEISCNWNWYSGWTGVISFTAASAWLSVTPLLLIHGLRLYTLSPLCANIHWVLTDLIHCGLFCFFYTISAFAAVPLLFDRFNMAADVFTLIFIGLALAAFAYHAQFSWIQYKAGETGRVEHTETTIDNVTYNDYPTSNNNVVVPVSQIQTKTL